MGTSPEITKILFVAIGCFMAYPEAVTSKQTGITRHYTFNIKPKNIIRLCHTKSIVTVNGKFPGPHVIIREGDRLVVKVVNHVPNNISITGMEFDSFGADGRTAHHTSRNVPFKLATLMCTTSLLPAKEELSSGMFTFHGLEQQ
ncbi:hypothetical protein Goshw_006080, partial [Gossypium schwendimanii]|nr:hypothetical protein [Gossypium schwendimanii]